MPTQLTVTRCVRIIAISFWIKPEKFLGIHQGLILVRKKVLRKLKNSDPGVSKNLVRESRKLALERLEKVYPTQGWPSMGMKKKRK